MRTPTKFSEKQIKSFYHLMFILRRLRVFPYTVIGVAAKNSLEIRRYEVVAFDPRNTYLSPDEMCEKALQRLTEESEKLGLEF